MRSTRRARNPNGGTLHSKARAHRATLPAEATATLNVHLLGQPLMPMNRALYPPDWEAISLHIRAGRALHRCECTGECGLHQPTPLGTLLTGAQRPTPRRCSEINRQPARWFKGRVILTVAHLCNCYPLCGKEEHLKAMCQRCHLRFDRFRHAQNRLRTVNSSSYRNQRYRKASKQFGIEDLDLIANLPAKKRRRPWINAAPR